MRIVVNLVNDDLQLIYFSTQISRIGTQRQLNANQHEYQNALLFFFFF